jgi:hypothetical protein
MTTFATRAPSAQLARDLADTLSRLRMARTVGDQAEVKVSERRLNWLLERVNRKDTA